MKSNIKNKIFSNAKYFLLVPVIVLMLAVIIFIVFSYNKSHDFKNNYSFNVSYKQDMSSKEYSKAKNLIANNLYDKYGNKIDVVTSKINSDIEVGTQVKVYLNNKIANFSDSLTDMCDEIKTDLNTLLGDGHVIISEVEEVSGINYSKDLLWTGVALLVTMAVMFAYFWIRFEFKTALTSLTIVPFVALMLSALTVLFRLPVSTLFSTPIVVSSLVGYIIYMILSEKVRAMLRDDKYNSYPNTDLILTALNDSKNTLIYILSGVAIIYLFTMLFFTMKMFIFAISGILGLIIATYVATIITSLLWTNLYRRDKDNRLKEQKDNEAKKKKEGKKKKTKEEEEKILV